ncbi:MAG: alpha-E domain-containing protein [Alphaproteobacteria bacterium]
MTERMPGRGRVTLSRHAEAIFWLARYMERAENIARIVDVQETHARDLAGSSNWRSIIDVQADEDSFYARHAEASATNVIHFYIIDATNPNSVASSIAAARANARLLRPLISTEMWSHLNVFHAWVRGVGAADIALHNVSRLCARIKEGCQTHYGITEGTFYRDQGWTFYRLGKAIERADQTTRLLDVKYRLLAPGGEATPNGVDDSQWNALLRAVAGYHAYRRVHPRALSPDRVAGFLLFHEDFPRSVRANLLEAAARLDELRSRYMLARGAAAEELADEMRAVFASYTVEDVVARGLHEFNDWVQRQLIHLTDQVGRAFFGYAMPGPDIAGEAA